MLILILYHKKEICVKNNISYAITIKFNFRQEDLMKRFTVLMIITALFFVLTACAQKGEKKAGGPYLAKVGSVTITQADFDKEMKSLPDFAQKFFQGPGGKEKFLDELVKKELLYQEAVKKGLDKDPEFKKKVEDFKKITLITQLLEKEIETKSKVTDQDAKAYYEKHKNELASVSQIRASHILVKTEGDANKIFAGLKKGEDFASVAKKSSIDTASAKNGGDLGYFSAGQVLPEIEAAAIKLKPGEISEPIKTKAGYEIIKVTDKKFGKPVDFDKVKNAIMQRITAEKQKDVFDSYIENLKKSAKVEINKEALEKLSSGPEEKTEPVSPQPSVEQKEAPKQGTSGKKD
jgi:EpsD family peptidyl-prolyl cis-trans isomerase